MQEPMTEQPQPPKAPGLQPPAAHGDDATQPVAVPAFAPPASPNPVFAPAEPWAPKPPAQDSTPRWATPPTAPPAPAQPRTSRGVGRGMLLTAVLGTAVLASGGTYLAVTAADGGRSPETGNAAVTTPTTTPGATQAPGGQPAPSQAPVVPPQTGQGGSLVDVVKAVSPAVVTITAEGVTETDPTTGMVGQGVATGSGVIFDANGLILTNHHVVAGNPAKLTVTLKDGRSFDARIYGIDTLTDLAIVKVDQTGLPTAPIGDSSTIQVGQQAIAIGSPLGQFTDSVTSGIVSALGRSIDVEGGHLSNLIQTDTAINPGNSGGPLLDASGNVIGINTAVAGDSQGIGFAIPINIARPLLAQASAGQPLARPWLGVQFQTIDPAVKAAANLPVDNGAWIPSEQALTGNGGGSNGNGGQGQNPFGRRAAAGPAIVPGGPAEQAGLKAGDIITAVNGQALDGQHPLDLVTSQLAPGQTVTLAVLRDGQTLTIQVTLGTRPSTS
jgi:S1-C subfamily serine protease